MIQAIQTAYNRRCYRSRTEARWAVFFDALGIPFQYEPDGFVVRSGCYLPDFWLPEQRLFFEVKGAEPTFDEAAKCAELSEAAEIDLLLAVGPPDLTFQIHWFDRGGQREGLYAIAQDRFIECGFWLVAEDHANIIGPIRTARHPGGPLFDGAIEEAAAQALSARFGQAWRRRPYPRAVHHPDRVAEEWFSDRPHRSAA